MSTPSSCDDRVPDISLAKRLIGFTPAYNLQGILDAVIEYYR